MARSGEKQGLRPVQDVLARLLHDRSFDASRFVIGYDERFSGAREAPLTDFLAGGEIPWHRIQSIRAGALTVWDRRARIDLLFGSGASATADHDAILRACTPSPSPAPTAPTREHGKPAAATLTPRACWRFDPLRAAWVEVTPEPVIAVEALHVATYNLLFDRHEADKIYSERRLPAALELLREREADLIALQEVTPGSLATILAEPWVRERYCASSGPAGEGVDPYGVVLLSRWPLELCEHRFSRQKALLLGRLELAGRPLMLVTLHLTSNSKADARDRRAEQLAALGRLLDASEVDDAIVLGDLNFGDADDDADENRRLAACGLVDLWSRLRPHEPGFTFDPVQNPLAELISRRGRAARFDRVLLRAPTGALEPIDIDRFGDRPFACDDGEDRYASDHFGVAALLELRPGRVAPLDDAPVHTSALVIMPPASSWPAIQAIRSELDPSYARWMPHVNLIYGFVPDSRFAAAAAAIAAVLRERPPFELRLGALRRFDHRSSTTLWIALEADPPEALHELQAALQAVFPACKEQSERGAAGFTPHLTVAKLRGSEAEIAATFERVAARIPGGAWTVDAVHLISRRDAEPFAVRRSVGLGRAATLVAPPSTAAWPSPIHRQVAATIADACVEALGPGVRVHLIGSARLGIAGPDADLDLVCAYADDRDDPPAAVADALARSGSARVARGGGFPTVRGELAGVEFDLLFARAPAALIDRDPATLDANDLRPLDEASRRALLGAVDADALVRLAGSADEYCRALARVRSWARARGLEGGAWGLLGGFSWAILVAVAAGDDAPTRDAWALVRRFFTLFATWPADEPVISGAPPIPGAITGAARRAPWPIYTPTAPPFNSARGLTSSTHALLRRELARAAAIVEATPDEAEALASLCAPGPLDDPQVLELVVTVARPRELSQATGAIDGHALGLLRELERAGAELRPRPWTHADLQARARVGLRGGERAAVDAIVEAFVAELRGADNWPSGAELRATID